MVRILIAESHPNVRSALKVLLSLQTELSVVGETDLATAILEQLTATTADVLLLDWGMVTGSAGQMLAEVHERFPQLRVVVISAQPEARQLALAAGAAFVSKSDPPANLLAALRGSE